ncbi:hypothetical protein MPTK1_4g22630 [Marchantia polymorpha subsp. ruderalis]|uniref:Uncharacterized protein n=2 Tax=Marchantia polymorpha TaxID=3197 RepID=A0AAF6BCP9_MARPO|nr:hypothetical protein MARPO_0020s0033 [Marchantia polymorpha]BBN09783.1 hypothetical protein Mp_4g22630 [Marchantia polymorpha subsp. ruderalis]|eukprot:PTQ44365.1 hypothetical protein MARPO_0020s0033 [Marchantia polymorpha]
MRLDNNYNISRNAFWRENVVNRSGRAKMYVGRRNFLNRMRMKIRVWLHPGGNYMNGSSDITVSVSVVSICTPSLQEKNPADLTWYPSFVGKVSGNEKSVIPEMPCALVHTLAEKCAIH